MGLQEYLKDIGRNNPRYSTLTITEERELALRAKASPEAKIRFIEHNLRLVVSKVMREYKDRYKLTPHEQLEMIIEGNSALERGFNKFEIRGNENCVGYIKFSTYIYNGELRKALDAAYLRLRHIRIPKRTEELRRAIFAVSERYFSEHGHYPSHAELVDLLPNKKTTEKEIKDAIEISDSTQVVSANTPIGEEGEGELSDLLSFTDGRDEINKLALKELKPILLRVLDNVPKYERDVLISKYFHDEEVSEISTRTGLPLPKIRTILKNSIRKLRIEIQNNPQLASALEDFL